MAGMNMQQMMKQARKMQEQLAAAMDSAERTQAQTDYLYETYALSLIHI